MLRLGRRLDQQVAFAFVRRQHQTALRRSFLLTPRFYSTLNPLDGTPTSTSIPPSTSTSIPVSTSTSTSSATTTDAAISNIGEASSTEQSSEISEPSTFPHPVLQDSRSPSEEPSLLTEETQSPSEDSKTSPKTDIRNLNSKARWLEERFLASERSRSRKRRATLSREKDVSREIDPIELEQPLSALQDAPISSPVGQQVDNHPDSPDVATGREVKGLGSIGGRRRNRPSQAKRARLRAAKLLETSGDATASGSQTEHGGTLLWEQSQDAGNILNAESLDSASISPAPVTGMWTSLQERLQQLSKSQKKAGSISTPLFTIDQQGNHPANLNSTMSIFHMNTIEAARQRTGAKETPRPKEITSQKEAPKPKKPTNAPEDAPRAKPKRKSKKDKAELIVNTIHPIGLRLQPVENEEKLEVPRLAHDLDRVLFNRGVYELQDKRSRVYNFDPYLSSIMPVEDFDFNALKDYITSSKDHRLTSLSAKHGMKYCGSTSSMTSILSHFHFLLSAWRPPNFDCLSKPFNVEFNSFTTLTRGPAAAFARLRDGVYAIDADKEFDTANILSMLGKSMEKLLTLPKEEFEKYRREHSHQISEEERNAEESFHYTTFGDFMLRSQLDAYDPRLPGTGMFDLKTRAVVSIRMDVTDYEKGRGYEIAHRQGQWESFEREYYDMIRAAFLKYSLQVRMGRMDGIFVAFHNTQRIFGFQYISLNEMDMALHGTYSRRLGDEEFRASLALLNDLLNRASERFPGRSLRLHVETRPTNPPLTYFFAEPVSDEEIQKTQDTGKKTVEKFESEVLGLNRTAPEEDSSPWSDDVEQLERELSEALINPDSYDGKDDPQSSAAWDELMAKVDDTVENDSLGLETVRDAVEQALEQHGLLRGKTEKEVESYVNLLVKVLSPEVMDGKDQVNESETPTQETGDEVKQDLGPETEEENNGHTETSSADPHDDEAAGTHTNGNTQESLFGEMHMPVEAEERQPVPDASLKDLILKVAEELDQQNANVGPFGRVLLKLAEQSKQAEPQSQEKKPDSAEVLLKQNVVEEADEETPLEDEAVEKKREIFGMYVTVRNKVNNSSVERVDPTKFDRHDRWAVEYTVTELEEEKAKTILRQLKNRRRKAFFSNPEARSALWYKLWGGRLARHTKRGQDLRKFLDRPRKNEAVYGAWKDQPLSPEEIPKAIQKTQRSDDKQEGTNDEK